MIPARESFRLNAVCFLAGGLCMAGIAGAEKVGWRGLVFLAVVVVFSVVNELAAKLSKGK